MKLSHLNGLRALEATLRRGTFSAAAEELGVTVAAVGQQIRTLEEYLGVKLFDRLPSGARPTAEARAVAAQLTGGFSRIEEALADLAGSRDGATLKVTLSHWLLDHWLSDVLPTFYARVPGVEVTFLTGEEYYDLVSGEADIAVRFSPPPGPELHAERLHRGWFLPVCTPAFAERHGITPGTNDLTGIPLYRLHDTTTDPAWVPWRVWLDEMGIRKDDLPKADITTGSRTALSGECLLLTGLTECIAGLREGRLVAPLGPSSIRPFTYGYRLVRAASRRPTLPMRAFRDWIMEERDRYIAEASRLLGRELN